MKKLFPFLTVFAFLFLITFTFVSPASQDKFSPARVKDISDRAYEAAVIKLLDGADSSIVMSMYILKPLEKSPVYLLVNDLSEALDRGVKVEIYLNTKFRRRSVTEETLDKPLARLRDKGAKIYLVTPRYRLHDKLIIVDERFVVEGSFNWSISAIKDNFESAVLIDSPELAKAKIIRLKRLPLKGYFKKKIKKERPDRPGKGILPKEVSLPKILLNDRKFFPAMVTRHDNRSMNTYLLLLAESERWKSSEFFISLEDMAIDLGIPATWSDTAKRRQVIKVLRKLKDRYHLIEINFKYGDDAWVKLVPLPGDSFKVKDSFFAPEFLSTAGQPGKIVFLIKTLLESEGEDINTFTQRQIRQRFYIGKYTRQVGTKEIAEGFPAE